jgi:aryl-alcohol dehydrogenase-like predicted oxidoreductase
VQAGMIREVGVSNFNKQQMRRAQEALSKYGLRLAANQVLYNLTHRNPERNGVLEACQEDQVALLAYSPLAQGMLTGKYFPGGPRPKGPMRARYRSILGRLRPLVSKLQAIGEAHGGKTPAQVALNWTLSRGVLPIPGAKNRAQAEENAKAVGWELTDQEIFELDQVSDLFTGH